MSQIALPNDLAKEAQRQAAMQEQARAMLEGLSCGIYEQLAAKALTDPLAMTRSGDAMQAKLTMLADQSIQAALPLLHRLGYRIQIRPAPPA